MAKDTTKKVTKKEKDEKSTKISKTKNAVKEKEVKAKTKTSTSPKSKTTEVKAKKADKAKEKKGATDKAKKKTTVSKAKAVPKTSAKTKSTAKAKKSTTVAKSKTTAKKTTPSRKASSKVESANLAKELLPEYYDLPYRYNQTIVKILAQTPTTLFVYWDISDEDKSALISSYGENLFQETKPVLIVHNTTHNYSFEIEINDFANSWYIRCQEPNCNYIIELGRRFKEKNNEYIYIDSSNNMVSQNDHILFEKADLGNVLFKNVKTNVLSSKDFGDLRFINNIDKLYGNIYDVYSALYNDDLLELGNPTSGEFNLK